MTKFLNISTDTTLGGSSASDDTVSSQKAIKSYVDDVASGKADDLSVVKKSATSQQTISLSSGSGTTALGVTSRSTSSYISFSGTSGFLASYGVTSSKTPTFYNGSSHELAYKTDIPTTTSSVTSGSTAALTSGGAYTALQSYQTTANLVTSVSSSSTNSQYPSAKLFYDTCGDIEILINAL